jgi:hypothetical protein
MISLVLPWSNNAGFFDRRSAAAAVVRTKAITMAMIGPSTQTEK